MEALGQLPSHIGGVNTMEGLKVGDFACDALMPSQISGINTVENLKGLVVTIARRRAIDIARRKMADKRGEKLTVSIQDVQERNEDFDIEEQRDNPSTEALRQEKLLFLCEVLQDLDETTRDLFRGHVVEGMTSEELSKKHHMTPVNVRVKINRGKEKLLEDLKKSPKAAEIFPELMKHFQA